MLFVSVVGLCCVVNGMRNVLSCPCPYVLLGEPVWTPLCCLVCVCGKRAKISCFVSVCVASLT